MRKSDRSILYMSGIDGILKRHRKPVILNPGVANQRRKAVILKVSAHGDSVRRSGWILN